MSAFGSIDWTDLIALAIMSNGQVVEVKRKKEQMTKEKGNKRRFEKERTESQ